MNNLKSFEKVRKASSMIHSSMVTAASLIGRFILRIMGSVVVYQEFTWNFCVTYRSSLSKYMYMLCMLWLHIITKKYFLYQKMKEMNYCVILLQHTLQGWKVVPLLYTKCVSFLYKLQSDITIQSTSPISNTHLQYLYAYPFSLFKPIRMFRHEPRALSPLKLISRHC